MDRPHPEQAQNLVEPGVRFLVALPDKGTNGKSREDFDTYVADG
ncbi:hypothetical protein [Streptomyces sp. NBC_00005]